MRRNDNEIIALKLVNFLLKKVPGRVFEHDQN